jgi:hypothetical protein
MRPWWWLALFVIANCCVFAWSILCDDGRGNQHLLFTAASATLLLQSPAIAWRILGASPIRMLLAAIILPLLVFEPWLGEEAIRYAHVGGDLQGIEQFLMWFIIVPVTVIAGIVCVAATVLIKPVPSNPEI